MFSYTGNGTTINEVSSATDTGTGFSDFIDGLQSYSIVCLEVESPPLELLIKVKHNFDKPIGLKCPVGDHQPIELKHLKRYYT